MTATRAPHLVVISRPDAFITKCHLKVVDAVIEDLGGKDKLVRWAHHLDYLDSMTSTSIRTRTPFLPPGRQVERDEDADDDMATFRQTREGASLGISKRTESSSFQGHSSCLKLLARPTLFDSVPRHHVTNPPPKQTPIHRRHYAAEPDTVLQLCIRQVGRRSGQCEPDPEMTVTLALTPKIIPWYNKPTRGCGSSTKSHYATADSSFYFLPMAIHHACMRTTLLIVPRRRRISAGRL